MEIVGHRKQREYLKRLAELGKIPHALLFVGPEKVGKKTCALEFARSLLGDFKKTHPDLLLISPEDGEIRIAQVKDLIWKLALKPYSAPLKIAIIDEADKMTRESQNCFLKTLEEPKAKTLLIIVAEHAENLLPTILSRCQLVKFNLVSAKKIAAHFPEEITALCRGAPGRAAQMLAEPRKIAETKEIAGELERAKTGDLASRFQSAKAWAERDDLPEILNIWQDLLRRDLFSPKNVAILKQLQNVSYLIQKTDASRRLALETLMLEF